LKHRENFPFIYGDGSIEEWRSFYGSGREKVRRGREQQLKNTLTAIGGQSKNWREFDDPKMMESVPISAPGRNWRN